MKHQRLQALAEEIDDIRSFDTAAAALAKGEERLPVELVNRLLDGENPLRVWREHRQLTQQALADQAGVGKSYISQLESGRKTGSLAILSRLAQVLRIDLDDLQ